MSRKEPELIFFDQEMFEKIADQYALEKYLRDQDKHHTPLNSHSLAMWELYSVVENLVQDLPNIYREVICFRFWDDMDEDEISEILDISPRKVRNILQESLDELKSRIQEVMSDKDTLDRGDYPCAVE